ncbi:MAG: hypothetical protein RMM58_05255 [Chloroflexota bacterium]|nr:hypothetical protein [Dehalococcoidia bacterium]MDW8253270.1 hypothetical protein [Chloroflexota bacterium]
MNTLGRGFRLLAVVIALIAVPTVHAAGEEALQWAPPLAALEQDASAARVWPGCIPGQPVRPSAAVGLDAEDPAAPKAVEIEPAQPIDGAPRALGTPRGGRESAIICSPTGEFPYPVDPYAYWPDFELLRGRVEERIRPIISPLLRLGKVDEQGAEEIVTEGPIAVGPEEDE